MPGSELRYGLFILALAYLNVGGYMGGSRRNPHTARILRFAAICAAPLILDFAWSWISNGFGFGSGPPRAFEIVSFTLTLVAVICAFAAEIKALRRGKPR